jgi:hypothetical protein
MELGRKPFNSTISPTRLLPSRHLGEVATLNQKGRRKKKKRKQKNRHKSEAGEEGPLVCMSIMQAVCMRLDDAGMTAKCPIREMQQTLKTMSVLISNGSF